MGNPARLFYAPSGTNVSHRLERIRRPEDCLRARKTASDLDEKVMLEIQPNGKTVVAVPGSPQNPGKEAVGGLRLVDRTRQLLSIERDLKVVVTNASQLPPEYR